MPEEASHISKAIKANIQSLKIVPQKSYEEKESEDRRARWNNSIRDILKSSGLPHRHKGFKISESSNTEWLLKFTKLEEQISNSHGMFALIGPRGTGKTQLAVSLAESFCYRSGDTVKYSKTMEFFMDLKTTYSDNEQSETDIITLYARPRLLVLDEMQVRSDSDWENNMLTYLIDKRYDASKSTIMISNLTDLKFKESVGPSIYDLLCEDGGIIECNWGSFRE